MNSTAQIRQNTLMRPDCRSQPQVFRTRNIRDIFSFGLLQYLNAIYQQPYANERPYILTYPLSVFWRFVYFLLRCKSSDLTIDCSAHLHHDDRTVACRPVEDLKLVGACTGLSVCFCVLHKIFWRNRSTWQTISIDLANRSQNHLLWYNNHVLKECVSWT